MGEVNSWQGDSLKALKKCSSTLEQHIHTVYVYTILLCLMKYSTIKYHHHIFFFILLLFSDDCRLWKFKAPTSGLAMYTAATQLCDEITLFGFYPFNTDNYNRTILHHYYEPELKEPVVHHQMPLEYKTLLELEKKGALRLLNNCTSSGKEKHAKS